MEKGKGSNSSSCAPNLLTIETLPESNYISDSNFPSKKFNRERVLGFLPFSSSMSAIIDSNFRGGLDFIISRISSYLSLPSAKQGLFSPFSCEERVTYFGSALNNLESYNTT